MVFKRLLVWLNVAVVAFTAGYAIWCVNSATEAQAKANVTNVVSQAEQQLADATPAKHVELQGTPVRLVIPRLAIDLKVTAGTFDPSQRTWVVDKKIVDFIPDTAPLSNTQGSMFLYGHNANDVLGKTGALQPGDVAYIYTDNNHVFSYKLQSTVVVKPTDTSVLNGLNLGNPGFKLMTCTGLWDQDRRIMTFTLESAA